VNIKISYDQKLYIAYAFVLGLIFQQTDLLHTAGSSLSFLFGHWGDYYEFNHELWSYNNYAPFTYWLFALWNLPIKLFGFLTEPTNDFRTYWRLMPWFKLYLVVFLIITLFGFKKLSKMLTPDEEDWDQEKTKIVLWAWLLHPIFFFIQFLSGQYEILMLCFMIWGLVLFLKKKPEWASLLFGLAAALKYFPAFVFFPVLVLCEKRFKKLVAATVIFILPSTLQMLPYWSSNAFQKDVLGFSAISKLNEVAIGLGSYKLPLIFLVWGSFCLWIFVIQQMSAREESKIKALSLRHWLPYVALVGASLPLVFFTWNPQWLMLPLPFMVLTSVGSKYQKKWLLLDALFGVLFVAATVHMFSFNLDMAMLNQGLLRDVNILNQDPMSMFELKKLFPGPTWLYTNLVRLIVLSHIVFKHPKLVGTDFRRLNFYRLRDLLWFRLYLGCGIFVIPALFIFIITSLPFVEARVTQVLVQFSEELPEHFYETSQLEPRALKGTREIALEVLNPVLIRHFRVLQSHDLTKDSKSKLQLVVFLNRVEVFRTEKKVSELRDKDYWHVDLGRQFQLQVKDQLNFVINSKEGQEGDMIYLYPEIAPPILMRDFILKTDTPPNFKLYGR